MFIDPGSLYKDVPTGDPVDASVATLTATTGVITNNISERTPENGIDVDGVTCKDADITVGTATVTTGVVTNSISEASPGNGIDIDGVTCRDADITVGTATATTGVVTNSISEASPGNGVGVDGVTCRDADITVGTATATTGVVTNSISERTPGNGVAVAGVTCLDGTVTATAGIMGFHANNLDFVGTTDGAYLLKYNLSTGAHNEGGIRVVALDGEVGTQMRIGLKNSISVLKDMVVLDAVGSGSVCIETGNFYPSTHEAYTCGKSANAWLNMYSKNGVILTSDARLKTDVVSLDADLVDRMEDLIRPVRFKWITPANEMDARVRFGFIAQEMEQVLADVGLNPDGYALFNKMQRMDRDTDEPIEGEFDYGIGMDQFTPLIITSLQTKKRKIIELQDAVADHEKRLRVLEGVVE